MLEPDSQDVSGWLEKGQLALQCHNAIDAYECFIQVLNLDPNIPEAWLQYGSVLEKLGCYSDAITANNNAQKLYANPKLNLASPSLETPPTILAAIAAKQVSADYWLQQGYALGDLGRYEDAVVSFEKAIEVEPNRQAAWFSRSNALAAAGRFQESTISYQKTAELNPQDYQTWNNFGYVWHQVGDYEQAIAHYDKAIACKPDCAPAWNNRGFALFHLGLYDTAIACYDTALSFNKNYAAAWHNRGNALRTLERYEEAIINFDQALAIQPDFQDVKKNRNLALRAMGREEIPEETSRTENLASKDSQEIPEERLKSSLEDKAIEDPQTVQIPVQIPLKPKLDLTRTQLDLAKADLVPNADFKVLQETAAKLLEDLQNPEATSAATSTLKRQLAESYQRQVDLLARHNPTKALELAEECKDRWMGSLRNGWDYQPFRPTYAQIQTLLSPRTAAIYWHLSPDTLTTFILKQNHPPQVFQSLAPSVVSHASPTKSTEIAASQHQELQKWLTEWTEEQRNYHNQELLPTATAPWRDHMEAMLFSRLHTILEIERLCLEDLQEIDQLILIPHRDLHLIPLHVLFPKQYIVTYLPSAQIGLGLPPTTSPQRLLSVEDPATQWDKPKDVSSSILFTQLESALVTRLYGSFRTQSIAREAATKTKVIDALNLMSGCFYFNGYSQRPDELAPSALALAGQDWLTCQDLCSVGLHNYALVCLSVEEAEVLHAQTIADEATDLVSGLLVAGAAHVLSTLWKVSGISHVLIMTEFHRKLFLEDLPPAQALAQTQQWLRTVTYTELSQWYQARADELAGVDSYSLLGERLQDFAKKAQAKAEESELYQYTQTPYAHPYYWAGVKISGNAF
jgi:tetratricopeptide (TPR) repeat protein